MLSSLYLAPVNAQQIINSIKNTPVKFYVDNNKFHFLSPIITRYLATQYQHFWGSIFLYAPQINAGTHQIFLKFPGQYYVKSQRNTLIHLDGKKLAPNRTITLTQGYYISNATTEYRLKLIPNLDKNLLDPRYKKNDWKRLMT